MAYYWVDAGVGKGASLGAFKDQAGAEESVRIAADFVQKQLASVVGKPELLKGEVRAHTWWRWNKTQLQPDLPATIDDVVAKNDKVWCNTTLTDR